MNARVHPYALALAMAAVSYVALAPWGHALGTGGEFAEPSGDLARSMTGAFAYIDDVWRWPLFETTRLAWPTGTNVIFSDPVPFGALLFKIIHSAFGVRINYLGAWFVVVWFGQALGATFLLRGLGSTRLVTLAVGTLVFLTLPPFLMRHNHLAASSHFTLLFALGIYFRMVAGKLQARFAVLASLVIASFVWIHFYLFAMCALIHSAALLDGWRRGTVVTRDVALRVLVLVATAVLLMWAGGYFGYSPRAPGFGIYSMNVLSPWAPQGSGWFGGPPYFDGTGGQIEGFQYMGLGALACAVLALVGRVWRGEGLRHHFLVGLCVLFTLFALSNRVYVDRTEILTVHFDATALPFSTFRSSGRFFWPVSYLVVALGIAHLERLPWWRDKPLWTTGALVVAATIQLIDVRHFVASFRNTLRTATGTAIDTPALAKLYAMHDVVHISPRHDCAGPVTQARTIELIYLAAKLGRLVDDVDSSRAREPQSCQAQLIHAKDDARKHLYVGLGGKVAVADWAPVDELCRKLGELSVCSSDPTALDSIAEAKPFELPSCEDHMTFSSDNSAVASEVLGWSHPESWGTWSIAPTAVIECAMRSGAIEAVSLTAQGFAPMTGRESVETQVLGGGKASIDLPHLRSADWRVSVGRTRTLLLTLTTESTASPASVGLGVDERELGIGLMRIDLVHASE